MYYESYFGLDEAPFSISPDPRYLYLTQNHREALAHLLYGVSSNGGFVLLTGEVGAGKTTICQCLLEQLPANVDVAYILNPKLEIWEFMAAICDDLGITYPAAHAGLKLYIDLIHKHLLESHGKGRNTVLMVDEAQNLSTELIEHLRLLTNLETREKKLLQIMLIGQPELRDKIALPELRQMAQRITARYHLGPLSKTEVGAYVRHRLKIAGAKRELFTRNSLNMLWKYTAGVPRLINIICDRALLGAYVSMRDNADEVVMSRAAVEVLGGKMPAGDSAFVRWIWVAVAIIFMGGAFAGTYYFRNNYVSNYVSNEYVSDSPVALTAPPPPPPAVVLGENQADRLAPTEKPEATPVAQSPAGQHPGSVDRTEVGDTEIDGSGVDSAGLVHQRSGSVVFPDPENASFAALELAAFTAIFRQWDINYLPQRNIDPCQFAATVKLGCMRGQGDLSVLRQMDRTAVLTLYDEAGRPYPAALLGLSGEDTQLELNGDAQRVSSAAIGAWWYGEYVVLWRVPSGYRFPLKVGASGPAVNWLFEQLGEKVDVPGQPVYAQALENKVKQFQRNNSLIPDGVVGPRTIIALNNQSGAEVPRLTSGLKE